MKDGGSREPLPFTSVDPLFYLSSFQTPFSGKTVVKTTVFSHFANYTKQFQKIAGLLCSKYLESHNISDIICEDF